MNPSIKPAVLHTRNVPPKLRRDFREWCKDKNVSMRAVVVRTMQQCLDQDKPIPAARNYTPAPGSTKTILVKNVPPNLKAKWKAWCARRSYTMEGCMIACIKTMLKTDKLPRNTRTPIRLGG